MNSMNSAFLSDAYKTGHHLQYPENTTLVYSNFTPRANKYAPKGCDRVVVFGTQMVMKQIHEHFAKNFFKTELRNSVLADSPKRIQELKNEVISEIREELTLYFNAPYDTTHFEKLWDLGYLPVKVKALEEGTLCPIKVPVLTIYNTYPEFYWIPNYLETIISNLLWKPMTSATIAYQYRTILNKYALDTDKENVGAVLFQGHDFSMRGMDSVDATISSGLGHLTSFMGTDSLPAVWGARKYYGEKGFVAGSVPATEHSVMCASSKEGELETFKRLLKIYPTGYLSVVSDTWDLWNVITVILPQIKDEILARDGKLVIRPDSGDPVDIICGFKEDCYQEGGKWYSLEGDVEYTESCVKGVIELLWERFGGTTNAQGYKVLNPKIGAIYGDSITTVRAEEICRRLKAKGFASTNIVLGVGSFTYQYNTRDTFGFAMKATYVEKLEEVQVGTTPENLQWVKDSVGYPIFKDPITDDGTKKSATGLLAVFSNYGHLYLEDNCSWEREGIGMLKTLYKDGMFYGEITLTEIRRKLWK